jgi:curved DNA-binding protein CbpA
VEVGKRADSALARQAMNYYAILGVAEDADRDTIRSAFRVLARRYHPDTGASSSTAEFRRILEAYEVLMDSARRRTHDDSLRRARQPRTRPVPVAEPLRQASRRASPMAEPLRADPPSLRPRMQRDSIEEDLYLFLALIERALFSISR